MTVPTCVVLKSWFCSSARRRSPSVKIPSKCPFASITVDMPRPLAEISISASASEVSVDTLGTSLPVTSTSLTRVSSRRPKAPPGWVNAKSSAVNPLCSRSAIASASPMTRFAVVLAVGARSRGQASSGTPIFRCTSAAVANVELALPVIATIGIPSRFNSGRRAVISLVVPLLLISSAASDRVTIPISP